MLNMLIASMTDTFANIQTDAQRDLALARAWIAQDQITGFRWNETYLKLLEQPGFKGWTSMH